MKIKNHVIITLTIGSFVYFIFNSFSVFIGSLIGGILIDIDHFLDYFLHEGVNFKIKNFIEWCYKNKWKKLIILFHSIELLCIFWLSVLVFNLRGFWIGLAIGVTQHMILDIIFNGNIINRTSYFFIVRFVRGFKKELIGRSVNAL